MAELDERKLFEHKIVEAGDRIVAAVDGLSEAQLHTRPGGLAQTSSLAVLATHTFGSVEEIVVEVVGGQPVNRDRDAEFADPLADAGAIRARWEALRPRIHEVLAGLDPATLGGERHHHRRGHVGVREVLLHCCTHATEHAGQAELTRDLVRAG